MVQGLLRLGLAGSAAFATAAASAIHSRATTNCSAAAIPIPSVVGANITSLNATVMENYLEIPGNNICLVTVVLTHPGTGDVVNNWVGLPLTGWNGIFQGLGGGGFTAGNVEFLADATPLGYAGVTTDAGHSSSLLLVDDATNFALVSPGNVDQYALLNFARRSYHDMTVIGKAVTESFYGTPAKYSYWNGCSTGGRQGLVMAQYYPDDYNGILAEAPAIQWNDFTPAQQWPFTVLINEGYAPALCEFDAVNAAVIKACDGLDGVIDGIISAPAMCDFEATSLIGQTYICDADGTTHTFTSKTADVVDKIWQGPRTTDNKFLWYGITKGTNFSSLAPTTTSNTSTSADPFGISNTWYTGFLAKNLSFDTSNISYAQFQEFFLQGHLEYDSTMGSASPDLRAFKKKGGKMITWQGLADNYINPQGTMLYYEKVAAIDPSLADFYRQFFSPGVGHCGNGTGVMPLNAINQLRSWVENGTAPATLEAASMYPIDAASSYPVNGTYVRFLDLCPYPTVNQFKGGDPGLASSYVCASNSSWYDFGGVTGKNYSCYGGPGWY